MIEPDACITKAYEETRRLMTQLHGIQNTLSFPELATDDARKAHQEALDRVQGVKGAIDVLRFSLMSLSGLLRFEKEENKYKDQEFRHFDVPADINGSANKV